MVLRTSAKYLEDLKAQSPEIYLQGSRVDDRSTHPAFQSTITAWGTFLYDSSTDPELQEHVLADGLKGKTHRFWYIPSSQQELVESFETTWRIAEYSPSGSYTRLGRDQLAALRVVTRSIDADRGTEYGARLEAFVQRFQDQMLMTAAAMTDPKGHRQRRPREQEDPDAYLRIVDRTGDGIVVRGAKAHVAGAVAAEEIIVLPGRALHRDEEDYAVAFAVPVDAAGLKLISRDGHRVPSAESAPVSHRDMVIDSLLVFDNVVVPTERVFMAGETEYAGTVASLFPDLIRQGYLATDVGRISGYLGAALLVAEANGISAASHVRAKLAEMAKLRSIIYGLGVASSHLGKVLDPGVAVPDPVLTAAGQQFAREAQYTCLRHMIDLAGAGIVTMPAVADSQNPSLAPYVEKYFKGATAGPDRIRALRLAHDLAVSPYAAWWSAETTNRSGSAAAEVLQMLREYDFAHHERLARRLAAAR